MNSRLPFLPALIAVIFIGHAATAVAKIAPPVAEKAPATGHARILPDKLRDRITLVAGDGRRGTSQGKPAPASRVLPAKPAAGRSGPVITATATGPGQDGYVHYFVIEMPDGVVETQIGIELPEDRIAWAVPELGVVVSPFIKSGVLPVNGKFYPVRHLYGIRPFADDESMLTLQRELVSRVVPWIDDEVAYCYTPARPGDACVSCLGFVLRILFPGQSSAYPALPRDFERTGGLHHSTEDLLLHLAGVHGLPTREARLKRIDDLMLPDNLRDDLLQLVSAMDATGHTAASPKNSAGKARLVTRRNGKLAQPRPPIRKL